MAADASTDVADDVSWSSQQTTVMALTWLLTRLVTWQMTSALTRPGQRVNGSTVRPDPVNGQPGQRSNPTRSTGQPGQWSDPTRSMVNRVNGQPGPVNTTQTLCTRCHALPHEPNLLVAREGALEDNLGQFWYLQIRIEIPYNVVYRLGMFEAFKDMKIRIEP